MLSDSVYMSMSVQHPWQYAAPATEATTWPAAMHAARSPQNALFSFFSFFGVTIWRCSGQIWATNLLHVFPAVEEVLPLFQKVTKDACWASAMAAMEPDEWCWQNPRQHPVQEYLDRLSKDHVLDNADVSKAMIFLNWSKVTVPV